ncbi:glycosyltransferase family 2 protein [Flavobacterium oreochromis]|uniref:Glycosyltransferase family 2 protein n=1 Tax=Flavobacterium oreochromis TaxID=2906078 RepID=A0ABW8P7R1_9FLAO|nr:glycosyltransferase family 2 protein [Flavobacterium oreochromis]OWP77589.1 glycosyltransferase [Flavobacterium oreochromis]
MKLTVFTPTYNRAYLLPRLYESLKKQTNKNFIWLVIDDGSTDETKELIEDWCKENILQIRYLYKDNQGMHSGHNWAYDNIDTEYNVCIDSDDMMPLKAVEIILEEISKIDSDDISGIVGLDQDVNGKVIGGEFPKGLDRLKLYEVYQKYGLTGDRKLVYKTKLMQEIPPYPIYENEKFVPLDYKFLLLDQKYDLIPINKILCTVEYQEDGSTKNILKQYRENPRGFTFSRISRINLGYSLMEKIKNSIHLISSVLFSKDYNSIFRTKHTLLVLSVFPLGILLYIYIRLKTKSHL